MNRASSHERSRFAARLPGFEASLLYSPRSLNRHQRQDVADLSCESQCVVGFCFFPDHLTRPTGVLDALPRLQPARRNQAPP
jgi:hypothetical protein